MRNTLIKFLCKCGTPYILRNLKGENITVLNLHRISDTEDYFYNPVSTAVFEKLLQYCSRNYEIIRLADMDRITKKRKLILSFDDGYYDFVENAIPLLKKYGFPSNHNLVNAALNENKTIWTQRLNDVFNFLKNNSVVDDETIIALGVSFDGSGGNWMNYYLACFNILLTLPDSGRGHFLDILTLRYGITPQYKMMNWDDARYCMEKCDVEIGSHTYNHDSLLTLHSKEELDSEIGRSVEEMNNKLGIHVNILALPNGQFNDDVLRYSDQLGIRYVLLADDKLFLRKEMKNPFVKVNRIGMVRESVEETILRTELFHTRIRKFL